MIRLCPLAWFDRILRELVVDKDQQILIASTYAQRQRHISQRNHVRAEDHDELQMIPKYCFQQLDCPHNAPGGKGCWEKHSTTVCEHQIPLRTGGNRTCGWFLVKELHLPNFSSATILATARPEPVREILLHPHPAQTHYVNREWAVQASVWQFILDIITTKLPTPKPVYKVAFSFGEWETAMDVDHRVRDCHAHVHLWLTYDTVMQLHNTSVKGRLKDPVDYLEENCRELELHRLLSLRQTRSEEVQAAMRSELTQVREGFTDVQQELKALNTAVCSIQDTLKLLIQKIDKTPQNSS